MCMLEIDEKPSLSADPRGAIRIGKAVRVHAASGLSFSGARERTMPGFDSRMAQLPRPEFKALQLLKDMLGCSTQRQVLGGGIRLMAELVRGGEIRRVAQHCEEFRGSTPLETGELLPVDIILEAQETLTRPPDPDRTPPVEPVAEPTEVVILRHDCGLNGEIFRAGRHVVPVSKAIGLRALDGGR